jgi:glucosyl-dolichyl phosphate glucuronosyltransferase
VLYLPEARVFHRVPASRTRFRRFISRCYFEGGSKAVVSRLVGTADGLSSERDYVRRVLPAGVRRGLTEAAGRGHPSGAARAGAIVAGLVSTAAGYATAGVAIEKAARRRGWSGPLRPDRADQVQSPGP